MRSWEALARFIRSREARGLSPKTIAFYHYCLDRFAAQFDELPEVAEAVEEYMGSLTIGAESRYDVWRALKTFYRFAAARWGVANPMSSIARPRAVARLPRTLSAAEVDRLLGADMSRRDRAMITILLDTGLRLGELECLLPEQIGLTSIRVTGKTGEREVPISSAALRTLTGVMLPWSGPRGRLTVNGIYLAIRRVMRGAGIRRGGPHALRHTFARNYILAGGDVFSLQRILGHRNVETTMIYVYMDDRDLVAQHEKYSLIARRERRLANGW